MRRRETLEYWDSGTLEHWNARLVAVEDAWLRAALIGRGRVLDLVVVQPSTRSGHTGMYVSAS